MIAYGKCFSKWLKLSGSFKVPVGCIICTYKMSCVVVGNQILPVDMQIAVFTGRN